MNGCHTRVISSVRKKLQRKLPVCGLTTFQERHIEDVSKWDFFLML